MFQEQGGGWWAGGAGLRARELKSQLKRKHEGDGDPLRGEAEFVKGSLQLLWGGQEQRQEGPLQFVVTTQVSDEGGSARRAAWRRPPTDLLVLLLCQSLH